MLRTFKPNWSVVRVWLLALGLAIVLTRVYWGNVFPYTHDGANHLARFVNYAAALREGQLPPRFAPYLFSGYGFPVFNYNYPLANILALPWLALGFHTEKVFAILVTGSVWLGIVTTFYALRLYFSRSASLIGTVVYSLSWYLNIGLVYRGGMGEIMAYALVPLGFWYIQRWQQFRRQHDWWLGVGVLAALLLAHNVMSLFGYFLLGLCSVNWLIDHRSAWRPWLGLWLAPVGLTFWFWLPALGEMNLVALAGDDLRTETIQHLVPLSQLFFSPWRFGFSRPGPLNSLGFGQGPMFAVGLFLAVTHWLSRWRRPRTPTEPNEMTRLRWLLALGLGISFFLASSWSSSIWQAATPLAVLQFPWRFLFITSLLLAPVAAWTYQYSRAGWVKITLLLALIWQAHAVAQLRPVDYFHYDQQYYLQFPHSTTTRNENRPRTFLLDTRPPWQPQPTIATGEATINVATWLGSRRRYTVQVVADTVIFEPTVYFPGWQVKADGQLVTPELNHELGGLVAYRLPARAAPYQITSGFTGHTAPRQWGEVISVLTILGLIGLFLWRGRTQ